jgi:4,5-dihydroxyphthalate decarboxylase
MNPLRLSIVTEDYDRIRALARGEVVVEGCELAFTHMEPAHTFNHVFRQATFDIVEMSFSSYMMRFAQGGFAYRALPIFLSRVFPHSSIYLRRGSGIETPADLGGRAVGMPNFHFTRGLVVKGMLADEYGVRPSDIRWRLGPVDRPGERQYTEKLQVPGLSLDYLADGACLAEELLAARLDAIISYRAPQLFTDGHPSLVRLFPDFRPVEQDWYRRTGIFPTMHVLGLRQDLIERHPQLPRAVCEAFDAAKAAARRRLYDLDALCVMLPWLVAESEATAKAMGDDFWPYGVAKNRRMIEAQSRWSFEQGLTPRPLPTEELFERSTLDWSPL